MIDPIRIIRDDHRQVEKLFKKYEDLSDTAYKTKHSTALKITEALTMHTEMEEKFLYPKLKERFNSEDGKIVEEAYAEHGVAKELITEIESMEPENPQFDAKVKVLNENITHHIQEEEEELLPRAMEELSKDELDDIGKNIADFRGTRVDEDEHILILDEDEVDVI